MLDRGLAVIAMALLIVFLGIVVTFVKEIDLTVVCVLVVLMAIYEIWVDVRTSGNGKGNGRPSGE
ncbi:MAG: hypothetical protein AAF495_25190 [Pseudomonadota bacterium]